MSDYLTNLDRLYLTNLNRVAVMHTSLTEINGRLAAVPGRLAELNNRLAAVPDRLAELNSRLAAVPDRLAELSSRLAAVPDHLAVNWDKLAIMRDQLAVNWDKFTTTRDQLAVNWDNLTTMRDRVAAVPNYMAEIDNTKLTTIQSVQRDVAPLVDVLKEPTPADSDARLDDDDALQQETAIQEDEAKPPPTAEKVLSFLISPDRVEEAIGDFEERFKFLQNRHGVGHARRWYWWQVFMIAARGIFEAVCKVAKIWFGPA